jgi:hypothetical protein
MPGVVALAIPLWIGMRKMGHDDLFHPLRLDGVLLAGGACDLYRFHVRGIPFTNRSWRRTLA